MPKCFITFLIYFGEAGLMCDRQFIRSSVAANSLHRCRGNRRTVQMGSAPITGQNLGRMPRDNVATIFLRCLSGLHNAPMRNLSSKVFLEFMPLASRIITWIFSMMKICLGIFIWTMTSLFFTDSYLCWMSKTKDSFPMLHSGYIESAKS